MKSTTYVNFAGQCAEAIRYYEAHLGANVGIMITHEQFPGPGQTEPGWRTAILHARFTISGTEFWAADIPNAEPMRSAYITLSTETDSEAERLFSALSEGGEVFMAIQGTPFASRFGQLRDRFGINWMVLHELPHARLHPETDADTEPGFDGGGNRTLDLPI